MNGQIQGPYVITDDLEMFGQITAGATLKTGKKLILHGQITGDLDVEAGATAELHGSVNGIVRNHGGLVIVYGVVDAVQNTTLAARTEFKEVGKARY